MSNWELNKENIRPARSGIDLSLLNSDKDKIADLQRVFAEQIEQEEEDAALKTAVSIVKQYQALGDVNELYNSIKQLIATMFDCQTLFNNPTFVRLWMTYADLCDDSRPVFRHMYDRRIGEFVPDFYMAWSMIYEQLGEIEQAHEALQLGLKTTKSRKLSTYFEGFLERFPTLSNENTLSLASLSFQEGKMRALQQLDRIKNAPDKPINVYTDRREELPQRLSDATLGQLSTVPVPQERQQENIQPFAETFVLPQKKVERQRNDFAIFVDDSFKTRKKKEAAPRRKKTKKEKWVVVYDDVFDQEPELSFEERRAELPRYRPLPKRTHTHSTVKANVKKNLSFITPAKLIQTPAMRPSRKMAPQTPLNNDGMTMIGAQVAQDVLDMYGQDIETGYSPAIKRRRRDPELGMIRNSVIATYDEDDVHTGMTTLLSEDNSITSKLQNNTFLSDFTPNPKTELISKEDVFEIREDTVFVDATQFASVQPSGVSLQQMALPEYKFVDLLHKRVKTKEQRELDSMEALTILQSESYITFQLPFIENANYILDGMNYVFEGCKARVFNDNSTEEYVCRVFHSQDGEMDACMHFEAYNKGFEEILLQPIVVAHFPASNIFILLFSVAPTAIVRMVYPIEEDLQILQIILFLLRCYQACKESNIFIPSLSVDTLAFTNQAIVLASVAGAAKVEWDDSHSMDMCSLMLDILSCFMDGTAGRFHIIPKRLSQYSEFILSFEDVVSFASEDDIISYYNQGLELLGQ
ncbi:hypothetical protein PCE1_003736 [Barthelona sp. PCE]